jgi:hypothetical protein
MESRQNEAKHELATFIVASVIAPSLQYVVWGPFGVQLVYDGQEYAAMIASVAGCFALLALALTLARRKSPRLRLLLAAAALLMATAGVTAFAAATAWFRSPEEFNRAALQWIFPVSYGLIFAGIGRLLASFVVDLAGLLGTSAVTQPRQAHVTAPPKPSGPEEENIHTVYEAPGEAVCNIVFIHGIHGDFKATWHPDDDPASYWPRWVGEDLTDVNVYSVQYNAFVTKWLGTTMALEDRAKNIHHMLDSATCSTGPSSWWRTVSAASSSRGCGGSRTIATKSGPRRPSKP